MTGHQPPAGNQIEQRRSPRRACSIPITIEWGAALISGRVSDITVDGMFVEIEQPLWVGASFSAILEADHALRIDCTVRRVDPLRGMALTYSAANETSRTALASYLERLAEHDPMP
jgi:hypothetical protein